MHPERRTSSAPLPKSAATSPGWSTAPPACRPISARRSNRWSVSVSPISTARCRAATRTARWPRCAPTSPPGSTGSPPATSRACAWCASSTRRAATARLVPVEVVSSVQFDAAGRPASLVGIVRDLSARREHEAAQRRFASMLNHEFRTPLSTIDGAIQRLESTGANADQPTRERYRRISKAVDRLIGMLDEYLSPDRMEAIERQAPGRQHRSAPVARRRRGAGARGRPRRHARQRRPA